MIQFDRLIFKQFVIAVKLTNNVLHKSTGAALTFSELLTTLHKGFCVFPIHIQAPLETCIDRVMTRDASAHIPVSDHRLREINDRALQVDLPWDLEINNSEFLNESVIV
jgi:hypothetical protein